MRAKKVDSNQSAVVKVLRQAGVSVQSLASIGKGCPDLLLGFQGKLYLFEIKDGSKFQSQQQLTPDQVKWHSEWTGSPVHVVNSLDGALKALGIR